MDRRHFFQGSAAAAAAGLTGCATTGMGAGGAGRTPFPVAGATIPVAGSDMVFPVRRIYCIGRNYRAHSIEMGSIGRGGRNIPATSALDHVWGYTLGLDMTRRDLQRAMGDEKKPWEIGKSFDQSAPLGPLFPVAQIGHFQQGAIWLKVNGQTKQNANLNQMIWSVAEQIAKLSEANELFPGDIIYSGTPENVGPVVRGDVMEIHIDKLPNLSVRVV
jgi:fumarylpyruvate hydrolase